MRPGESTASLRLPPRLPPGATLGIVAPSSPVPPERLERGLAVLHRLGFRTVLGKHLLDRRGHLAGQDADRAADVQAMFARDEVHGIVCARGGSGAIRMLPYVEFDDISDSPKVFIGYSDVR